MAQKKKKAPTGMPTDRVEVAANAPLVLIVEDDEDAATVARGMLNLLGYRSQVAPDAHDALHILHQTRPAMILLDVNLPTMDGLSLLRIARQLKGVDAIPVVAASAYYGGEGPIARQMRKEGIHSFLDKPFTLKGLREAIDGALGAAMKQGRPTTDGAAFVLPGREETRPTYKLDRESLADIPSVEPVAAPPPVAPPLPTPPRFKPAPAPPRSEPEPSAPAPVAAAPARPTPAAQAPSHPAARRATPPSIRARGPARRPGVTTAPGSFRAVTLEEVAAVERPERSVVREVSGTATDEKGGWPVMLDRCTSREARFFGDRAFTPKEQLRLQFTFRAPVNDAMTDLTVRMLARTTASVPSGGRFATEVALLGMGPQDAFAKLLDLLRD